LAKSLGALREALKHDAAHGGVDYGEACFGQTLVIPGKTARAGEPRDGSLDMR